MVPGPALVTEPSFQISLLSAYVNMFMRHLCEPDLPSTDCYGDGVPKDNVPRQNVLTRIGMIRLVRNKVVISSGVSMIAILDWVLYV